MSEGKEWQGDVIREEKRGDFEYVKDLHDGDFPETLVCLKCGYDRWIVGQSDCLTVVKCPICKYESEIHKG